MKRDEIRKIIPDITDEQLNKIMDINSTDIGKAKGDYETAKADLDKAKGTIADYEKKIGDLEKSISDGDDFKKKFEDLKKEIDDEKAEAQRKADEAAAEQAMAERFKTVVGDKQWRDELTGEAVYSKFKSAVADEANKGKGDKDILEALTKDKGYFSDPSKTPGIFTRGTSGGTGGEQNPFSFNFAGVRAKETK